MRDKIENIIYEQMKVLYAELDLNGPPAPVEDIPIYGQESDLDSNDLVRLIVGIEQDLSDELGLKLTLATDKAFSRNKSPFLSTKSLADYIMELQGEVN